MLTAYKPEKTKAKPKKPPDLCKKPLSKSLVMAHKLLLKIVLY